MSAAGYQEKIEMEREYIGRYHITSRLGRGGMGTVVRAFDEVRQREVAIKLPNDLDPDSIDRLKQECTVVSKLEHHHIVQVYGSGSESDLPFYIVMEYIDGITVEELLRQQAGRPLEMRQALKIALGVAEALAYAHKPPLRVIHRDIKPGNVLIRRGDEVVKVTDFGIAAVLAEKTGRTAVGTLAYMAPEQAMGRGVDERSDLYALGAMLYEMLTGQRPPQIASAPARAPSGSLSAVQITPDMGQRIDRLVLGLLERDPDRRRPRRAEELAEELRAILEGRPTRPLLAGAYDPTRRASSAVLPGASRPPSGTYPANRPSGAYPANTRYPQNPAYPSGSLPYPQQPVVVNVVQQVQQQSYQPVVPVVPVVILPSSSKASTALTLAILSIFFLGPFLSIPAIIVGHMALGEIGQSGGRLLGQGKAVAALIIGYIVTGSYLLLCIIIALVINSPAFH